MLCSLVSVLVCFSVLSYLHIAFKIAMIMAYLIICIALYKFVGNLYSFFESVNAIAYRTLILNFAFAYFRAWETGSLECLLLRRRMNLDARD